ncbi:MAG TPA: hypothetical protein VLS49_12885 [Usitatibacter sp.]|nr:hypothetical protein [Usitatibacter sp.]
MTARLFIAGAASALLLATALPALAADPHAHSQGAEPPAHGITLDHGRKWATDAPLREGMGNIREALERRHAALAKGALDAAAYAELGAVIEKNVASIVANCKLGPEADANLHVVVAQLVDAADSMRSPSGMKRIEGAQKAMGAVDLYGRYFDHPGWKPLA